MWRSSWSRHAHAILHRHALPAPVETDRQTDTSVDGEDASIADAGPGVEDTGLAENNRAP